MAGNWFVPKAAVVTLKINRFDRINDAQSKKLHEKYCKFQKNVLIFFIDW